MEAQKKLAAEAETEKATMLNKIGNILSADVVISKTEDDNKKEQHENINRKSFCEKKTNKK